VHNQDIPIITLWFSLNEDDKKYFKNLNINNSDYDIMRICKSFNNLYSIYFADSLLSVGVQ